jgi:hypothetical protein
MGRSQRQRQRQRQTIYNNNVIFRELARLTKKYFKKKPIEISQKKYSKKI